MNIGFSSWNLFEILSIKYFRVIILVDRRDKKIFIPVHLASCSQVALWASRHFWPALISWHPLQQGEFLSLHMAPTFRLRLQNLSQQGSESSEPKRPASHSSLPSTRKLPQKDSSGSVKQRPAFASKTARIERSEHGENLWISWNHSSNNWRRDNVGRIIKNV